jgi:hypothetical protein
MHVAIRNGRKAGRTKGIWPEMGLGGATLSGQDAHCVPQAVGARHEAADDRGVGRRRREVRGFRQSVQAGQGADVDDAGQGTRPAKGMEDVRGKGWPPRTPHGIHALASDERQAFELGLKGVEVVEKSANRRQERAMEEAQARDDSGLGFSDAEHEMMEEAAGAVMGHQMAHSYQPQVYRQHPYQHHQHHSSRGRLSVHSMLSPSPSAAGHSM